MAEVKGTWDGREDGILRQAWQIYGDQCCSLVAQKLGRSIESVRKRSLRLNLTQQGEPRRARWTASEVAVFNAHWRRDRPSVENARLIAKLLNRSAEGILYRAETDGLTGVTPTPQEDPQRSEKHARAVLMHGGFPTLVETRTHNGKLNGFLMDDGRAVWAWPAPQKAVAA